MHISAFEICKFSEILPLLLVLLLVFFQYGFWMYRKAGHMEATFVEFFQLSCKSEAQLHTKVKTPPAPSIMNNPNAAFFC